MALASDDAIDVFRNTPGLLETVRSFSSYSRQQKIRRRWIKYPLEVTKRMFNKTVRKEYKESSQTAFVAAGSMKSGIIGEIQATSNKLLGALGHNPFIPKTPGQRGLRILSLDGGGTRGVVSIGAMKSIVDSLDGMEVCDSFDMIAGTSTGAIIAFLVGLKRESNEQAKKRYDELIKKIFVKSRLSKAMLLLTTATYSETPFKSILQDVLGDYSMLDTRADPRVPLVLAVSAQMSSTHSKVALFRNYNYAESAKADKFVVSPAEAKQKLGFPAENCDQKYGTVSSSKEVGSTSRHEGSFRILQRAALRATTAAPTIFKPVQLGADMYSDGGLVASNPTAIAISEARTLFPDVPIEMVVSVGTGDFVNEKVTPSFGWDGIISQIIKSATDTEKIHWVLKDILGQGTTSNPGSPVCNTKYFRVSQKRFRIKCIIYICSNTFSRPTSLILS
jgi:predicted acylesterase/phospholipase RssA